jgi:uncharacterized membrane protein YfcA
MDTNSTLFVFLVLMSLVAFFYSSVGHGGASGYLALMAIFNFSPQAMKPSALMLNILVSGIAFYQYYKAGNFKWKIFLPFIFLSVPMAFIGAGIKIDASIYKIILGICLIIASMRLLGLFGKEIDEIKPIHIPSAVMTGGIIGFLSGMIGIGGGIILSPLLLLLHWARMKETAAVSALFIFVNSIAGLAGLINATASLPSQMIYFVFAALTGGMLGSYYGSDKFNTVVLKYLLTSVLLFASVKLFII